MEEGADVRYIDNDAGDSLSHSMICFDENGYIVSIKKRYCYDDPNADFGMGKMN
ncbi:MAG: hypothetical protein RR475_10120 [Clostridia bacterium]